MDLKDSSSNIAAEAEVDEEKFLLPAHSRHVPAGSVPSMTINPDLLNDYFDVGGKSSGSGTIREMLDSQFEVVKGSSRTWQQLLWHQAMLMIASHMDSGSPLHRIICLTIEDSSSYVKNSSTTKGDVKIAAGGGCDEVKSSGNSIGDGGLQNVIIIDILSIKQMATSISPNTPVVFIRYATTMTGSIDLQSQHDLLLAKTSDDFPNSCTIHCTCSEIESVLSILDSESRLISSSYQRKWKKRCNYNGTSFKLSLIRPVDESLIPSVLCSKEVANGNESTDIQPRRQKQIFTCSMPGCTVNAQYQCSLCKTSYYCSVDHQRKHRSDHKIHCIPPTPPSVSVETSTLTESTQTPTTAQSNVSVVPPSSDSTTSVSPVLSISEADITVFPPAFNPLVDVWPGTVGFGSTPPAEDIWDDSTPPRRSVLIDLKNLTIEGVDPRSAYSPVEEHKIFWVRILLPFLGRGTELVVDETSTFKVEIGESEVGYDAIYDNIRTHGWRRLKGYFPTRRHGDYLRIYVDMMERDLGW